MVSVKHLEGIPLRLEPLDGTRKGIEELVLALEGVVEGDDAARTGVAAYVEQHVATVEAGRVVAGNEVPHDDAVTLAHHDVLVPLHPAMGRTEEVGL